MTSLGIGEPSQSLPRRAQFLDLETQVIKGSRSIGPLDVQVTRLLRSVLREFSVIARRGVKRHRAGRGGQHPAHSPADTVERPEPAP